MKDIKRKGKGGNSEKKIGVVRATFSLPSSALSEIDLLRKRLAMDGVILNKSEVVRVGLAALEGLPSRELRKAINEIDRLRAGRPPS